MVTHSLVNTSNYNAVLDSVEFIVLFFCMLSLRFLFSAKNMALLAEEICGCKAELLSGGLNGDNATTISTHLWGRQPVLIPYPPSPQINK